MTKLDAPEYIYRPLLRPASAATLPPELQWSYIEAPALDPLIAVRLSIPLSRYPHGIIAVDRKLTSDERDRYGMQLL